MSSDSLLGKQLDEYRIDKPLGSGGMARVYRALDTKLRRYVALKVIAPNFRTDAEYARRFEREAQSIARLEHPNIVHIYRFGEVDGLYYIAMQYVDGVDLSWLIRDYRVNGEVMPMTDITRVVQEIGAALDYIHSKDVIHRDVKPGNILLDSQGRAMLTDFGLALLSDVGTKGEIFGSPQYIAPEQALSSSNVVPQSDLYALGVTLFEMLTGELPFGDGDPMNVAMRHMTEPPPNPSTINSLIPGVIDKVVLHSLEKEPYDRYQTGAELSAALQSAITSIPAEPFSLSGEVRRPSLIVIPQKVSHVLASRPGLPPLPPGVPSDEAPTNPSPFPQHASIPGPIPDLERTARVTVAAGGHQPAYPASANRWRFPLLIGGGIFVVGLIGLTALLLLTQNNTRSSIALVATATSISATTAIAVPPTNAPAATETPPTSTPVVLPTLDQVRITTVPTVSPSDDRSVPPSGSHRLGEFAVEGYCNGQGYGVQLVNNRSEWACTKPSDNSIALVLGPADFDSICRSRYSNPAAFAIRDQHKDVPAYNWSCYEPVLASPVSVPTSALMTVATPTVMTLRLRLGKDWVALVNVSNVVLSLSGIEFRRTDHTLAAVQAWGRNMLMPGECLRIFKGPKAPKDLPSGCASAIDYNADKNERETWFTAQVTIAINPSTTYCYPSERCGNP